MNIKMALSPNDISRLVHHYLLKEGYKASAKTFVNECPYLTAFAPVTKSDGTRELPRLIGPSLTEIIDEYFYVKDCIVEELQRLFCCSDYRNHDSLLTLSKMLVAQIRKLKSPQTRHHNERNEDTQSPLSDCPNADKTGNPYVTNTCINTIEVPTEEVHGNDSPQPSGNYETNENAEIANISSLSTGNVSNPEEKIIVEPDQLFLLSMPGFLMLDPTHTPSHGTDKSDEVTTSTTNEPDPLCPPKVKLSNSTKRKRKKSEKERLIQEIMSMATSSSKSKVAKMDRKSRHSGKQITFNQQHHFSREDHQTSTPTKNHQSQFQSFPCSPRHGNVAMSTSRNSPTRVSDQQDVNGELVNHIKDEILEEILPDIGSGDVSPSPLRQISSPATCQYYEETSPNALGDSCELSTPSPPRIEKHLSPIRSSMIAKPVVVLSNVLRSLPFMNVKEESESDSSMMS